MPLRECDLCGHTAEGECVRCGMSLCGECVYYVGDDAVCDQCMSDTEYAAYLEETE